MIGWITPEQKRQNKEEKKSPVLEDSFAFVNDKLLDILALDKTSREYLLAASDSKTPFMITDGDVFGAPTDNLTRGDGGM